VTAAIVTVVLALDPIGIARVWPRRLEAGAVVAVVLGAAALLATTALDVLDLSPEGYWIAAGLVLLVPGVGRLVQATTRDVAGPAAVVVTVAAATRDGTGATLVAVAVAAALTVVAVATVRESTRAAIAERFVGAGMVVVALDLVRDGVMAV